MTRSVSPRGRKFIYAHEGVVLKAYRDAVGVWTIGAGLTAASGVIAPKAGQTITAAENDRLFDQALTRNYLPRVIKALGASCSQAALDAGASFDFNTGGILQASWVKSYLAGRFPETRQRLGLWTKGGGKVLPGLTRRRAEEADVLLLGRYPANIGVTETEILPETETGFAVFVVSVTADEVAQIKAGLAKAGFGDEAPSGRITRSAIEAFQKAYGLTVDGKIGRATLSTLQRELDGRAETTKGVATVAGGGGVVGGNEAVTAVTGSGAGDVTTAAEPAVSASADVIWWIGGGIALAGLLYLAWLAWHYRDLIAMRVAEKQPRLAAWLRSF